MTVTTNKVIEEGQETSVKVSQPGEYDTGHSQLMQEVPMSEMKKYILNSSFFRRAAYVLYYGIGSPLTNWRLWSLILFNLGCQIAGAWTLQNQLYILATGRNAVYPGLGGCLKSGCNSKAAPGDPAYVQGYIGTFIWLFVVGMALLLVMSFTGDAINAIMRKNISSMFQSRLLKNDKLLYRLTVDGSIDNIDQRITSDLQSALDGFCCVLFGNSADYLAYPVLFMVTRFSCACNNVFILPQVATSDKQGKIIGMVVLAITIAIVAYILPVNHVSKIFYRGQRYEGDFRTTHTRAVLNAEQISTLRGEPAELHLASMQYQRVDKNNRLYYLWQGLLLFLRLLVTISIPACAYVCLAISEIADSTTANFFQKQIGDVFEYFLYLPVYVERLAFACGATHRVGELVEAMSRFEASPVVSKVEYDEGRIELAGIKANPPVPSTKKSVFGGSDAHGGRSLFEGVSLVVKKGESACIVGPSGCGKSSLLRVISGLWGIDEGVVVKPSKVGKGGLFFLPQKPYVFPGNLLQQIIYPATLDNNPDEGKARDCLKLVHLQQLLNKYGLQTEMNWSNILSFSEMQRLNFARMFYHEPAFCLADESTSALDLGLESLFYKTCTERKISMISIAHRPSVIPHHDFVIRYIEGKHAWEQVPSSAVATEGKFPTDCLEELLGDVGTEEVKEDEQYEGLNCAFFKRFCRMIYLAFRSQCGKMCLLLFVQFIAMCVYGGLTIEIFRDYGTSTIIAEITGTKPFTWATRNLQAAYNAAGIIIGLNSVISIVQAACALAGAWIAVNIQYDIISEFHKHYFSPGVVYHMNRLKGVKSIDQRMVQDLSGLREALAWIFGNPFAYCNYRFGIFPLLIVWLILLGYGFSTGWQLSIFLFGFMGLSFLWQIIASFITSKQVGRRQRWEGDLRLHLGRTLQNIETITFFGGQEQELSVADGMLESLFWSRFRYYGWSNFTSLPTISMYYWLQTGIYVMAAVVAIWWAPGSASVSPTNLFTTINFDIIWSKVTQLLIMCLGGLGMVIGFTHRVMDVLEKSEHAHKEVALSQGASKDSSDAIALHGLSIIAPSASGVGKTLVKDLNFQVQAQDSIVVSGYGKSSVLRVMAGMWPVSSGSVSRPELDTTGVFFVPQGNYAVQGTLASQVVYPKLLSEVTFDPDVIKGILEEVGLGAIAERWGLDQVVNWDVVLSGGECQRLGFARVLFHKPKFAVLDETTSALDMATEEKCMTAVKKRNIGIISFATRPSVAKYHSQKFSLSGTEMSV